MKLYGLLPNGQVVTRTTRVEYQYALVRRSYLAGVEYDTRARCSENLFTLIKAASSGDVIVGLTRAPLKGNEAKYVTTNDSGIVRCYPKCYACDNPGLGRAKHHATNRRDYVPACITRHAQQEVVTR